MLRTGPISPNQIASRQYEFPDEQFGSSSQDPLNTESVLQFFKRNWKICAAWMIIGLLAGVTFLVLTRDYYTAYTTILLEDRTLRPFSEGASNVEVVDATYADSQVQVLQSREVIGRVVDELNLTEDAEFGGRRRGLRSRLVDNLPFLSFIVHSPPENSSRDSLRHVTILRINDALSVQRIGISNAVEIGFTSRDSSRAAAIANAVAQAYIDSRIQLKQQAREDAASQLRERLAEARERAFGSDPTFQSDTAGNPNAAESARDRFRELQSTTETYRTLYNNFLQRYTEAVQQLSLPGARIITPAEPPLERSWPPTLLVLIAASVGGAAIGFGHSLLRQLTDRTLENCDDLRKATGLDCLVQIGRIRDGDWKHSESGSGALQDSYLNVSGILSGAVAKVAVYLQAARMDSNGSIIGVAALQRGGGASTVAAHFARIVAQSGQKALLIDANWQHNVHESDAAGLDPGQRLAVELTTDSMGSDKLDVLVLRGDSLTGDLSASQAIMGAILSMRAKYAWIVVDFHAVELTADAAASISLLDDMLLVAEARRTTTEALRNALRLLPREKISVIMNKAAS